MQLAMHMVTIKALMPREHFLRKLEAALDLSFVYEETAPLYSKKYGRPAIDPVVIVKYLLVGFLYGIPSERQIERRVQTDIALRWYLGLDLFDRVPDHSTVSQLRRRKPSFRKVFRRLFEEVVGQCIEKGLVSGRVVGGGLDPCEGQRLPCVGRTGGGRGGGRCLLGAVGRLRGGRVGGT